MTSCLTNLTNDVDVLRSWTRLDYLYTGRCAFRSMTGYTIETRYWLWHPNLEMSDVPRLDLMHVPLADVVESGWPVFRILAHLAEEQSARSAERECACGSQSLLSLRWGDLRISPILGYPWRVFLVLFDLKYQACCQCAGVPANQLPFGECLR